MRIRRFLPGAVALSGTLVLLVAGSPSAGAAEAPSRLGYNPATGQLIFVGAAAGSPLASTAAGAARLSPEQNGLSFIRTHARALGLRDADQELRAFRTSKRPDGRTVVRYRQVREGVPVFGADVVVNTTAAGRLMAMSAKISRGLSLGTRPTVTPEDAVAAALAAVAKYDRVDATHLKATTPALWIYDARLLVPDGRPPVLAWKLEVSDGAGVRDLVMVDARRGAVVLHFSQIDHAWRSPSNATLSRATAGGGLPPRLAATPPLISIYDMLHACEVDSTDCSGTGTSSLPGTAVCSEADPLNCSEADAQTAYAYLGDTHAFYTTYHGRDSIDGAGMRLVASVHYGLDYENAFWNGSQMIFGDGYSAADDVVGHELTHGVTGNESGLIYYGQSGAINESFSDVWGEFIDQVNGAGTDAAAVKWLMGEDLPGTGAVRSMKNPPAFGDPDSMTSARYYTGASDSYGVHTNSGVNNKAAYLMVDGGVFNGKTVAPLGIEKVAAIYYEVQTNLLGSGANYIDLYYALSQACVNVVGTHGIALADCQSVRAAGDAVKMNQTKSAVVYPTADYCPVGQAVAPVDLFNDDLEGGSSNWSFGSLSGTSQWTLNTTRDDSSSGSNSLFWQGPTDPSDSFAEMNSDVVIPTGAKPYLRFEHDYGFDTSDSGTTYYDGGVVEYSTDGGATWTDLGARFNAGKNYVGVLQSAFFNPLGGRKAFAKSTINYTESRYALSTLAGHTFRIRFRAGSDDSVESGGWFVDDVRIYTCLATPARPVLRTPANNALITDYTPLLDWSDSIPDLASYDIQIATDAAFASLVVNQSGVLVSEFTVPSDLTPNTKYYWRVRALNANGATAGWTTTRYFRAAMEPPVLSEPLDGTNIHGRRPTFDWADVAGATGYTLQASKVSTFAPIAMTGNAGTSTLTPTVDLPPNTLLYWRVKANGPNGPTVWSAVRTLTTGNPPSVPALLSPALNALTSDRTPRLDWAASIVPTGTSFQSYELMVDDHADFTSPEISVATVGVTAHEYTPTADLAAGTKYYWKVRSSNTDGDASAWSAVRYFRIAP